MVALVVLIVLVVLVVLVASMEDGKHDDTLDEIEDNECLGKAFRIENRYRCECGGVGCVVFVSFRLIFLPT